MGADLLRTRCLTNPDAESVDAQYDRVSRRWPTSPGNGDHLEAARADLLAFTAFPKTIWRQIWSNKSPGAAQQRSLPHRRCRHLPHRNLIRLVGSPGRTTTNGPSPPLPRPGVLSKSRADHSSPTEQEATPAALTARPNLSKNHATSRHHAPGLDPSGPPLRSPAVMSLRTRSARRHGRGPTAGTAAALAQVTGAERGSVAIMADFVSLSREAW